MSGEESSTSEKRRAFLKQAGIASVVGMQGLAGYTGGDQGNSITLGVLTSFTGDTAVFGQRDERGTNLALKHINDSGGVLDKTLEAQIEDTATTPSQGVSAAQKLVNQVGVQALLGSVSSGVTMAIAKSVTVPNKILHMGINFTTPKQAGLEDDGYLLRTSPPDTFQGIGLARVVRNEDVNSVSVIAVNNAYGKGLANAFKSAYEEQGGDVLRIVPYQSGKATYKPQLNQAAQGDPEALVFISYAQSFQVQAKQAFEMGLKDRFRYFAAESIVSDAVENNVPAKALNGMVGTTQAPPVKSGTYQEFKSAFEKEFGEAPTIWSAYTYDGVTLVALAIQKAGKYESTAMRDVIYDLSRPPGKKVTSFAEGKKEIEAGNDINYQGVSGTVNINDAGDPPGLYRRWVVENGEFKMGKFLEVKG